MTNGSALDLVADLSPDVRAIFDGLDVDGRARFLDELARGCTSPLAPFGDDASPRPFAPADPLDEPPDFGDAPFPSDDDARGNVIQLRAPRSAPESVVAPAPPKVWRTFAERADLLGLRGKRMPTGFATLDHATRGGPISGRVIVVGGAPGSGKTSLEMQIARHFFVLGHAVGIVAADEEADGLAIRWGQMEGLRREDLERGDEAARHELADAVRADRLLLVDQDEEDATLEEVVAKLVPLAQATALPGVLIVDSIQTVRTIFGDAAESPRERINCAVAAIKRASKVDGLLVLVTSEMARGFYRGGADVSTSGLASFKESGSIEYAASVALSMRSVAGESDLFDVAIEKNRLGEKLGFRLRMDRERATLEEVAGPGVPDEDDRAAAKVSAREARVEKLAEKLVLALVRSTVPISGQRALRTLVPGANEDRANAVAWLLARGRIVGGGAEPYRAVSSSSDGESGASE